jgi:hypothetical protein
MASPPFSRTIKARGLSAGLHLAKSPQFTYNFKVLDVEKRQEENTMGA